jgi:hypothetical protein
MHPDNLCVSEWNLFEDNRLPVCLVGAAETAAPPIVSVRRPIGFRPPSDWVPSAVQSVSVRRPIGFRSLHDDRSIESGRNFLCLFFTDF